MATPAIATAVDYCRLHMDTQILHDDFSLAASKLLEPGWIDPDYVACIARLRKTRQFLVDSVVSILKYKGSSAPIKQYSPSRSETLRFHNVSVDQQFCVTFCDEIDVTTFVVDDLDSCSVWRSVRSHRKSVDQFDGKPTSYYEGKPRAKARRRGSASCACAAIASALSLATLLGVPARTIFDNNTADNLCLGSRTG